MLKRSFWRLRGTQTITEIITQQTPHHFHPVFRRSVLAQTSALQDQVQWFASAFGRFSKSLRPSQQSVHPTKTQSRESSWARKYFCRWGSRWAARCSWRQSEDWRRQTGSKAPSRCSCNPRRWCWTRHAWSRLVEFGDSARSLYDRCSRGLEQPTVDFEWNSLWISTLACWHLRLSARFVDLACRDGTSRSGSGSGAVWRSIVAETLTALEFQLAIGLRSQKEIWNIFSTTF